MRSDGNTALGVLRCPDDNNYTPNEGNLSYVVNGGFSRFPFNPLLWVGLKPDGDAEGGTAATRSSPLTRVPTRQLRRNSSEVGVMFLNSIYDNIYDPKNDLEQSEWAAAGLGWGKDTLASITDGMSATLLIGESTLVGYSSRGALLGVRMQTNWAAPFPNFCMFIASDDICEPPGASHSEHRGLLDQLFEIDLQRIRSDDVQWQAANKLGPSRTSITVRVLTIKGTFPFVTSGHPTGDNYRFCDGHVTYLTTTIDGTVYSKLVTPEGSKLSYHLQAIAAQPGLVRS